MKRKYFYLTGLILSSILLITFYSYFWYQVGKYPLLTGISSLVIFLLYILIIVFITYYQYKSPYHELNKSVLSTLLYGLPLFILLIELLFLNDFGLGEEIFVYIFTGLWFVAFLTYFVSIFAKE